MAKFVISQLEPNEVLSGSENKKGF